MTIKNSIIKLINKLPYVRGLFRQLEEYKTNMAFTAGHYYSPVAKVADIKKRESEIWKDTNIDDLKGLNLYTENQISLVKEFYPYYKQMPFPETKDDKHRYYFQNGWYTYTDAIFLYSMMRHFKPTQIIEVGSGFSSAVMLDTNELFFDNKIKLTFIDPYADRLKSILKETDKQSTTIIEQDVQVVPLSIFENLNEGDFLFIDSSHVLKVDSDVHHIFFEILPRIKKGVFIHFHDIFYPFQYPKNWVYSGIHWNEDYVMRAFLMYNEIFEIRIWANYLEQKHKEIFTEIPLCYKNTCSNFWIQKVK